MQFFQFKIKKTEGFVKAEIKIAIVRVKKIMNDEEQIFFSQEQLEELKNSYLEMNKKYNFFISRFGYYSFSNEDAEEFVKYGFSKRIMILKRCIDNVYRICPPDIESKLPDEQLHDVNINLQAFFINVYGALDALAWVWVKEKNVSDQNGKPLPKNKIGFAKKYKDVRKSFSDSIQKYLDTESHQKWYAYVEGFRHSLAHRIPFHVPSAFLSEEEVKKHEDLQYQSYCALGELQFDEYKRLSGEIDALGKFMPIMINYFDKDKLMFVFHAQIFRDWTIVMEICELFMKELKSEV